jgi:hypothetical protein
MFIIFLFFLRINEDKNFAKTKKEIYHSLEIIFINVHKFADNLKMG